MTHSRRVTSGFTLVELSMVSVVLMVMSAVIVQSIRQMSLAESTMREQTKITSSAERVMAAIETDISHAMRVFAEHSSSRDHLARLAIASILPASGGAPTGPVLTGSRLPVATMSGTFEPDPIDAVQAGNLLLLARKDGALTIDCSVGATPRLRRIDLVRFVVWFLHSGPETGVDLARYGSVPLARLADVQGIQDLAERGAAVQRLREAGVSFAWDPRVAAAGAFFELRADGTIEALAADGSHLVPADRDNSEAAMFATRHVGIAANGTPGVQVPSFARATSNFPHGFELKRDGDGSGDLMLVRLVVANRGGANRTRVTAEVVRQVAFRSE